MSRAPDRLPIMNLLRPSSRPPRSRSLAAAALAIALLAPAGAARAATGLSCEAIPGLVAAYLQHHVIYHSLDEPLKTRVVDAYMTRIDPTRTLYLESEAKQLQATLRDGMEAFLRSDCSRLGKIHSDVVARTKKMEEFVRAEVAKPDFALDPKITLQADPTKRGFPKTPAERDALYRALIGFQVANYRNAGLSMEEAKEQLVHRYEVLTKQTAEQDPEDQRAAFLDAFATGLDPHSNYLSPDDAEEFDIQMGLSLEGIGLALSSRDGYAVVEEVIRGGAADRQGSMKRKDKIVAVGQEGAEPIKVVDYKLRDVVRMIRGPKGTPVHLTVLRPSDPPARFQVTIVRDKIDLEEQAAKLRFEEIETGGHALKLAVLELPSFYGDRDASKRQAERDVRSLLKQVREAKADGLLLDLSRNGGGLLDYAISISGFFVRDGGIVAVRPGKESPRIFSDPDDGILYSGPMLVLTSRVTASASEILAGALQDYKRALVVGDDQTFGKGTVQSVMPLSEELGKLKVTTAMFFRPGGQSTQLAGVHSDIVLPSLSNNEEFAEGAQPGALPTQSIPPYVPPRIEDGGFTTWQPVTPEIVAALAARSKQRVATSEEFAKVNADVAKAKKNAGVVELAEVMKTEEKAHADADDEDDDKKPTPQLTEAIRILADYVSLQQEKLASTARP